MMLRPPSVESGRMMRMVQEFQGNPIFQAMMQYGMPPVGWAGSLLKNAKDGPAVAKAKSGFGTPIGSASPPVIDDRSQGVERCPAAKQCAQIDLLLCEETVAELPFCRHAQAIAPAAEIIRHRGDEPNRRIRPGNAEIFCDRIRAGIRCEKSVNSPRCSTETVDSSVANSRP